MAQDIVIANSRDHKGNFGHILQQTCLSFRNSYEHKSQFLKPEIIAVFEWLLDLNKSIVNLADFNQEVKELSKNIDIILSKEQDQHPLIREGLELVTELINDIRANLTQRESQDSNALATDSYEVSSSSLHLNLVAEDIEHFLKKLPE